MFEESIIVQSAISAFNNAALAAPAFLWWAVLAMPLFWIVGKMGDAVRARIGFTRENMTGRVSLAVVVMTLIWLVLFGGNYGVLRDGVSLLPFMTAAILLAAGLFIGTNTRDISIPKWRGATRRDKLKYIAVVLVCAGLLARSDMHAWWGPLLQIGTLALGLWYGRRSRFATRAIPGVLLIIMATTTVILMQPEFFRFGQLGNLTPIHLGAIMCIGICTAATVAARNINQRARIHRSAYIKLKWMARFVCLLGFALFILTESVPVFLGTTVALFASFAMSIWHGRDIPARVGAGAFAATLIVFGTITVMPVITVLGLLYWDTFAKDAKWRDFRFLL